MTNSSSSDVSLGSTELQPPLFKIVKRSKWGELSNFLELKSNHESCKERDETGLTLLGISLGYHAPLEIIKLIVSIDPNQLSAIDMFGANPLHQACLNGNPPTVISYLIEEHTDLVSSRDKDHRTPLHQITECICRDEIHLKEGLKVIDILCRYNCVMIHALDNNNNCPLDVVHVARNSRNLSTTGIKRLCKVTRFLRKISFQVYRMKKKAWEEKTSLDPRKGIPTSKSFITGSTSNGSSRGDSSGNYCDPMGQFLDTEEAEVDNWSYL